MFQDEVEKVELPAIAQLQQLGWRYIPEASLSPVLPVDGAPSTGERGYFREVVLVKPLEAALRRLNPWISEENLRKGLREITHPHHAGLMEYLDS